MDFISHLKKYLSDTDISKLNQSLLDKEQKGLILNEEKMSKSDFLALFPHLKPHPVVPNGFIYDKDEYDLGKHFLFDAGVYYIQEPSAMLVSYLLNPKENDLVLDLCSAPGGKAIGASLLMNNNGLIIANDLSYERAKILSSNVERMGRANIIVTSNDFAKLFTNYLEYFDKIILDAPCSGSGMFRKNDKMIEDWSFGKVVKYSLIQKNLITMAFSMLKPGGTLIYSTCSYSYEEDEDVIKNLLSEYKNASVLPIADNPLFYRSKDLPETIHLFPYLFPGEGHYIALIKKDGIRKENVFLHNKPLISIFGMDKLSQIKIDNCIYGLPCSFNKKLPNILRYGLKICEDKNGIITPDHHLSHYLDASYGISVDKKSAEDYLDGQVIKLNTVDGYQIVAYQNINLGFAKVKNGVAKNHYPKGLRRRYFL